MKTVVKGNNIAKAITALRILGDPTRFQILLLLSEAPDGLCVYEIAEGANISHSAASHQLAKLEAHNVVESFREGQTMCYELRDSELTKSITRIMNTF